MKRIERVESKNSRFDTSDKSRKETKETIIKTSVNENTGQEKIIDDLIKIMGLANGSIDNFDKLVAEKFKPLAYGINNSKLAPFFFDFLLQTFQANSTRDGNSAVRIPDELTKPGLLQVAHAKAIYNKLLQSKMVAMPSPQKQKNLITESVIKLDGNNNDNSREVTNAPDKSSVYDPEKKQVVTVTMQHRDAEFIDKLIERFNVICMQKDQESSEFINNETFKFFATTVALLLASDETDYSKLRDDTELKNSLTLQRLRMIGFGYQLHLRKTAQFASFIPKQIKDVCCQNLLQIASRSQLSEDNDRVVCIYFPEQKAKVRFNLDDIGAFICAMNAQLEAFTTNYLNHIKDLSAKFQDWRKFASKGKMMEQMLLVHDNATLAKSLNGLLMNPAFHDLVLNDLAISNKDAKDAFVAQLKLLAGSDNFVEKFKNYYKDKNFKKGISALLQNHNTYLFPEYFLTFIIYKVNEKKMLDRLSKVKREDFSIDIHRFFRIIMQNPVLIESGALKNQEKRENNRSIKRSKFQNDMEDLGAKAHDQEVKNLLGLSFGDHLVDFILALSGLTVFNEHDLIAQGIGVDAIKELSVADMLQFYNISQPESPKVPQTENKITKSTSSDTSDKDWVSIVSEMVKILTASELKTNPYALLLALFMVIERGNKAKVKDILKGLSEDERRRILLTQLRTGDPVEPISVSPLVFAAINSVATGDKSIALFLLECCDKLLIRDQSITFVEEFLKEKAPTEQQINYLLENTISLSSNNSPSPYDTSSSDDGYVLNSGNSSPSSNRYMLKGITSGQSNNNSTVADLTSTPVEIGHNNNPNNNVPGNYL